MISSFWLDYIKKNSKRKINVGISECKDSRISNSIKKLIKTNLFEFTIFHTEDLKNIFTKEENESITWIDQNRYDYESNVISKLELDEKAQDAIKKDLNFGMISFLKLKYIDCAIAGCEFSTRDILLPIIKLLRVGKTMISSYMFGISPDHKESLIFADCAVMPNPDKDQLATIAELLIEPATLIYDDPKIAFLSFSSYGSSKDESAVKVNEAVKIFKDKHNDIAVIGETQLDAAINPETQKRKLKSNTFFKPNVLLFPSLDAGNIGYKLVQEFARWQFLGPVIIGTNYIVSDLSRGCSEDDVYQTIVYISYKFLKKDKK